MLILVNPRKWMYLAAENGEEKETKTEEKKKQQKEKKTKTEERKETKKSKRETKRITECLPNIIVIECYGRIEKERDKKREREN